MPAGTLQRPIEDWWGITHEIAHAIYWASDFYNKDLPTDIRQYFEGIPIYSSNRILFRIDIEEIYANWFDFKYIFQGDKNRYFPQNRFEARKKLGWSQDDFIILSFVITIE